MVTKDQRQRQLAREKFLRQQQRRESARRKARTRNTVIAAVLAVAVLGTGGAYAAGAFSGDSAKDTSGAKPSPSPSASKKASEPKMAIDKKAKYDMAFKTSAGDITVAMDAAKTPHTVNSFKHLADKGFFDGTKCHRLTTKGIYVLQCGDPEGTGAGGPGYTVPDENLGGLGKPAKDGSVTYKAGTVAMANTGQPDSGGSQFFLVYKDSKLTPTYTPVGTMDAKGLKVVQGVAAKGVTGGSEDGAPKEAVKVSKATVTKK
ncbi:peptidylprolyl isomerase [Streptomyces sp. NBC_00006]|uniref:peptidylprolyl isomerase n=1 Tax=unclassified Streptomyces TaxID=2593676 RepID=UPI00224DDE2A|nr:MULTISPECIES: peptidylprolyl isomerase [unclassified Streptomyces]MCX4833783.1 peptidylprolyl isomerase [Streptomyces sp. NBC_01016]MCX5534765.1 peptidylprolyl isomerase [Streptomyces sp. NBC_00006]